MPKKQFEFSIDEIIECIKESPVNNWGKFIARMSFDNKPSSINIRNMNVTDNRISTGIALSDEEIEITTNTFVKMGYGDLDILKKEVIKRESRFGSSSFSFQDEEECFIDITDEGVRKFVNPLRIK